MVGVRDLPVRLQRRDAGQNDECPHDGDGYDRILDSADRHRGDGVHDGQKPIQRHENQGVDAGIRAHDDQVLYHPAPDVAEQPVRQGVVERWKWNVTFSYLNKVCTNDNVFMQLLQ